MANTDGAHTWKPATASRIRIGSQEKIEGEIFLTPDGGVGFSAPDGGDAERLREFYGQISHMFLYRDLTDAQRLGEMARLMNGYYTWAVDISHGEPSSEEAEQYTSSQ